MSRRPDDLDALTLHVAWVRRLALQLVHDPTQADDLAQDACLSALQHDPGGSGPLRAWLATVVRNGARQAWRRAERRGKRESEAARAEAMPSTLDLVERVATHRLVVDAVLALDEPYRSTLLQRYFEELTPAEIATTTGTPLPTVKARLQRGLARLREALGGDRGGDGPTLLRSLAPLLVPLAPSPAPILGPSLVATLAMSTFTKLALLFLAIAGGLFAVWPDRSSAVAPSLAGDSTSLATSAPSTDLVEASGPDGARKPARSVGDALAANATRNEAAQSSAGAAPQSPAAPRVFDVRGRVLGVLAEGLPGIALAFEPNDGSPEVPLESGPNGEFLLEGLTTGGRIEAASEELLTIFPGQVSPLHSDAELVIVVAPRLTLAGRVLDVAGRAIAGASVEPRVPEGFRARFEHVMDYSGDYRPVVRTDTDGRFTLNAPALSSADLSITHEHYLPWVRPLPSHDDLEIVATLERPALDSRTVTGHVLDAAGRPAAEARVAFGVHGTSTDEEGAFRIDLDDAESPNRMARSRGLNALRIVAAKAGHQPAMIELELDAQTGEPLFPPSIVLRLGGPPLSVVGRVVDPAGEPVPRALVWARDATALELGRAGVHTLESVVGNREPRWSPAVADADGRFVVEGLLDRPYVIAAHDPDTLLRVEREARPGGAPITLVLDSASTWRRVAGKVVDRQGRPVAHVSVAPATDTFFVRYQGQIVSTSHASRPDAVETDEDGRFELENVPRELVYLRLDGEDVISDDWGRHTPGGLAALSDGRVEQLEVVVRLRVHVQVHLADPSEADSLRVLAADGTALVINQIQAGMRRESETMPFTAGRSEVLTVDDSAATLVLLDGDEEVRRMPLALQRGQLNRVDA